jgi:molybdate transport system substrate-binding protein
MRPARRAAVAAMFGWALALAPRGALAQERELRVFAAASLTEVITELADRFAAADSAPRVRVRTGFGSSSELARQITDGAPADVFVSASPEWIDFLREKNALGGEPVVFARNALVCVAPNGSGLGARGVRDLASLFSKGLAADDLVAIADAGVPAGEYARRALDAAGLLRANQRRLVGRRDVRAVLQSVETGEARAGFVYATDAQLADVELLFGLDPATHAPILYLAAVTHAAAQPALARRFVAFLRGAEARRMLAQAGFLAP